MPERPRALVVGGGTMGRGIAGLCALSDHPTAVYESDPSRRRVLFDEIAGSWERAVARGKLAAETAERARGRLSVPERLEDVGPVGLAVEAVPEELPLKQRVFAELDRLFPHAAFLASNTSALSITEIARSTRDPGRIVGLHFFNPVAAMPLVEVVQGRATSEETLTRAFEFAEALGKQAIRVKDAPGFATSRLGVALGLEAMRMVEENVASAADIDRAMELGYGHRLGPLKTSDLVGLDVRLAIAETLAGALDDRRFAPPEILRRLVAEGKTGKKSGQGFYRWDGDSPRSDSPKERP
jgi:3-hydroxybutyryl-CoA dehydrogenase